MIPNSVVRVPTDDDWAGVHFAAIGRHMYAAFDIIFNFIKFKRKTFISADRTDRLIHQMTCKMQHPIFNNTLNSLIHVPTDFWIRSLSHHTRLYRSSFFCFDQNCLHNWPNAICTNGSCCWSFCIRFAFLLVRVHERALCVCVCVQSKCPLCTISSPLVKRFASFAVFRFSLSFSLVSFTSYTHLDGTGARVDVSFAICSCRNANEAKKKDQIYIYMRAHVLSTHACAHAVPTILQEQRSTHTVWKNVCLFHMVLRDYRGDPHCRLLQFSFLFHSFFLAFLFACSMCVWRILLGAINIFFLLILLLFFVQIRMKHMLMFIWCVRNMWNRKENTQRKINLTALHEDSAIATATHKFRILIWIWRPRKKKNLNTYQCRIISHRFLSATDWQRRSDIDVVAKQEHIFWVNVCNHQPPISISASFGIIAFFFFRKFPFFRHGIQWLWSHSVDATQCQMT